jgi:hypothetical protein
MLRRLNTNDIISLTVLSVAYLLFFAWDLTVPGNLINSIRAEPHSSPILPNIPVPWRYRIVPNFLTWFLSMAKRAFPALDYHTMWLWTHGIMTVITLAAFYIMLRLYFESSTRWATLGAGLFITAYPVIFMYHPHVYGTLGDPLGYATTVIALVALCARRYGSSAVLCTLAVLTRETNAVLLIPLLLDHAANWKQKVVGVSMSVAALIGIRIWLGWETTYVWIGLNLNLQTSPAAIGLALFATFGVLWLVGVASWVVLWRQASKPAHRNLWLMWAALPFILCSLLVTNAVGGVLTENRILFLAFPWIITLSVVYLQNTLPVFAKNLAAIVRTILAASVVILILGWLFSSQASNIYQQAQIWFNRYGMPGQLEYIVISVILSGVFAVGLSICYRQIMNSTEAFIS